MNFLVVACFVVLGSLFVPRVGYAQEMTHTFIGLSPSSISETDLLRDRAIEKTVNLQRDLADLPLVLEVEFTGTDGRFLRGPEEVFFEEGQFQTSYTFELFPEAAATGQYEAQVSFLPQKTDDGAVEGGTGFGIRRGVALKVDFTVTDEEVLEYNVSHTELRQTEVGLPFYFSYTVNNTGNVEWRPEYVEVSFVEAFASAYSDTYRVEGESLEPAQPGNMSTIKVDVEHELPIGHYDATIDFYDQGRLVHSAPGSLIVFEKGTLAQSAQLLSLKVNKEQFAAGENIQLTARMKNDGDITTVGVLVTEVYAEDGTLVDILTSNERSAAPGQEVDIDQLLKLQDAGNYRIESAIEYAGTRVTDPQEVVISIEDTLLSNGISFLPYILLGAAFLLLVFVILLIFRNIHRHNKAADMPIVKQPPAPVARPPVSSLQPMAASVQPQSVQPVQTPTDQPVLQSTQQPLQESVPSPAASQVPPPTTPTINTPSQPSSAQPLAASVTQNVLDVNTGMGEREPMITPPEASSVMKEEPSPGVMAQNISPQQEEIKEPGSVPQPSRQPSEPNDDASSLEPEVNTPAKADIEDGDDMWTISL